MNEQELCKKKLIDLSRQANRKGIVLFSDFLNLNELNIYHQNENFFETKTEASGGVPFAERQIVAFIPDALYYEWQFPIAYLEIVPSYPKFAEKLGHRDILGSMMNLGVDRSKLGDIVICEDKYFLICEESMAPYFMENLDKIRHTVVKLSPVSADALGQQQQIRRERRDHHFEPFRQHDRMCLQIFQKPGIGIFQGGKSICEWQMCSESILSL